MKWSSPLKWCMFGFLIAILTLTGFAIPTDNDSTFGPPAVPVPAVSNIYTPPHFFVRQDESMAQRFAYQIRPRSTL